MEKPEIAEKMPRAGFLETLRAVLWSFFGVRRERDHDSDMARLNPVYVILVGVLATVAFVFVLLQIAKMVVAR